MILMNQQNNNIYNIKMVLFIQICTKIFLRNEKKNKNGNHSNDDQNKLEKLILKLNKFLEKTENKFKLMKKSFQ